MHCPACQTPNPEGAKFCMSCGTRLAAVCPACGTPATPGARFCHNCGAALTTSAATPPAVPAAPPAPVPPAPAASPLAAASRLEQYIPRQLLQKLTEARAAGGAAAGERRVVTVLFCDVQGSTAMAEQLDPEEWAEIMNGAFEHLIRPVYRYEGTLARLMGDAILAFFGAPIAHEDDPRRAVLAGLEILEGIQPYRARVRAERGFDFNVRVGINTGLVVVGEIGSDLRVEYTAMGDAVNLAARMEQTAVPGTVQVTAATRRLVHDLFDVEPLGPIEVKGKAEPVEAFRVLSARDAAVPTRGIQGLRSPLVGRDRELERLRGHVDALRAGRGQVVAVMGEAGLGKSRLVAEVRQYAESAAADSPPLLWLEGRSFSYETGIPYTPFVRLLEGTLGLAGVSGDAARYARLAEGLEALLGPEGARAHAESLPYLASLLGIGLSGAEAERVAFLPPPMLRMRVFQAVRDLVAALARRQPTILVFEDLHWADPTSLDLLEHLLPLAEEAPLLLLALFRPHREDPSYRFHQTAAAGLGQRYDAIALEPLGEGEARTLVANLLHVEDLPEQVRALILAKAEGNPFYVEEVIRSLLDSGLVVYEDGHWRARREIASIVVPETLAGVITARLDRLEEEPKRVAQSAAVVGREFQRLVLEAVCDEDAIVEPALLDLERRELIRARDGRAAFAFKHVLTQETAYASLLLSRRRELHRRAGECLERVAPERVAEIAHHFLEAREPLRAAPYLVEAGDRAARAYASAEAVRWFRQALDILEGGKGATALARRAYEGLAKALELSNAIPDALETLQRMLREGILRGDAPIQVSARNKLAYLAAFHQGEFPAADAHLQEAERMAREVDDAPGLVEHATIRCGLCIPVANFDGALGYLGESVEIARERGMEQGFLLSGAHLATTLTYMARLDEAHRMAGEVLAVAEPAGDLEHQAEVLSLPVPWFQISQGDLEAAIATARRAREMAGRIGSVFSELTAAALLGRLLHLRGEYAAATTEVQLVLQVAHVMGPFAGFFLASAHAQYGLLALDQGREVYEQTRNLHAEPLAEYEPHAPADALVAMGWCALRLGDPARAAALFERAISQPTVTWLLERPNALAGAASAALGLGDPDAAARRLEEARAFAAEHAMRHVGPLLDLVEGQVALARGDGASALARFERASAGARAMGLRSLAWQADEAAARALDALSRRDEAAAWRDAAAGMRREIAAFISDEDRRAAYLAAPVGVSAAVAA